jgi:hypothetical protein
MRGLVLSRCIFLRFCWSACCCIPHTFYGRRERRHQRRALSNFLMPHHRSQRFRKPKHIFISPTKDYP